MKSAVTGVAGAARIDQLSMAELTYAELHGKRLDKTGRARAINSDPPLTTTGLNLNELYHSHVAGAFKPKSRAKAMQVVIQFPKDLVDGDDAALMLRHARAFTESVFGPDSIFADRVDRDEQSRHVVDIFIAPKYVKKTKHEEKVAVTMSRHQKELARIYNCPPTPIGTGRALQHALFEYLRDEMKLNGVKRGEQKLIPGPDWKLPEQLRVEELAQQKSREDARELELDARERQADSHAADLDAREARVAKTEEDARLASAAVIAERAEIDRRQLGQDRAIAEQRNVLTAIQAAVVTDRAAINRQRLDMEAREAAIRAGEDRARREILAAERTRRDAETVLITAVAQRDAAVAARQDVEERRALHVAQLALLARAADDDNGLDLRLGTDTFTIRSSRMTEAERAINTKWSPPMVIITRALAMALNKVRDAARRIGLREKEAADREAKLVAREAQLERDRADHDARRAEHQAALVLLARQRIDVKAAEVSATAMAELATKTLEKAKIRQAEADGALSENHRWIQVMDALEADPESIEIVEGGTLRLDRYAAAARPDLAQAFQNKPPAWIVSLAVQRLDLSEALKGAEAREGEAAFAAERLSNLIEEAGPILTPAQQAVSKKADGLIRPFFPDRDGQGR